MEVSCGETEPESDATTEIEQDIDVGAIERAFEKLEYKKGSVLEGSTVTTRTRVLYQKEMTAFVAWCDLRKRRLIADCEVEDALVDYMNDR